MRAEGYCCLRTLGDYQRGNRTSTRLMLCDLEPGSCISGLCSPPHTHTPQKGILANDSLPSPWYHRAPVAFQILNHRNRQGENK